jgi:hypothetical protein
MDRSTRQGSMQLARGAFARIRDAKGLLVQVHDGELWLTQDGDSRDYLVGTGESFRVQRGGLMLAYALRSSSVSLIAPMPSRSRWMERLARAWFGAYVSVSRPTSASF